ncbi:hypothetical protein CBER1_03930 [Cercospora berteroae]|uniref:AMP-dependent synthetase/ligase domain-containing protein n=1 Tax=Cercospora berteroae TaxID=357750 RepID=A0A2S6C9V5_9PEZI|nr:hypothetical protein CBER1_03930 [Cercospora berteroae]
METDHNSSEGDAPHKVESLPLVLEKLAREYPNNTWMKLPLDAELTKGWRDITYRELADAVDALARWIVRNFGIGYRDDAAAYIGINDMRYAVAQTALIKAGYMLSYHPRAILRKARRR